MTIRPAIVDDLPAILRMAGRFLETEYARSLAFAPEVMESFARALIANPDAVGLVAAEGDVLVGMLAMTLFRHPMSGETIVTEVCWWMEPEVRGGRGALRMLDAGKAWARAHGATRLQMIAPSAHVGAFYERLGFELLEMHYQTRLAS